MSPSTLEIEVCATSHEISFYVTNEIPDTMQELD